MTDLTDRMRTCAAFIMGTPREEENILLDDAAKLLVEAAHEIDVLTGPIDLGEPMEVIPPIVTENAPPIVQELMPGQWVASGDTLVSNPYRGANACPKCDSRANKTVRKKGKSLWLVCPVCEHAWTR